MRRSRKIFIPSPRENSRSFRMERSEMRNLIARQFELHPTTGGAFQITSGEIASLSCRAIRLTSSSSSRFLISLRSIRNDRLFSRGEGIKILRRSRKIFILHSQRQYCHSERSEEPRRARRSQSKQKRQLSEAISPEVI